MLVLSRKVGEKVYLETSDGRVEVMLTEIHHDRKKVRLGFVAPASVKIMREELIGRPPAAPA